MFLSINFNYQWIWSLFLLLNILHRSHTWLSIVISLKFQDYFTVVIRRKQKGLYISPFSHLFWCSSFIFPSGITFLLPEGNPETCLAVSVPWLMGFFSLIMDCISLLLCTPGNFWLGAKHCESYLAGYWRLLYSYKYSWTLPRILLSYLETVPSFLVLLLWCVGQIQKCLV